MDGKRGPGESERPPTAKSAQRPAGPARAITTGLDALPDDQARPATGARPSTAPAPEAAGPRDAATRATGQAPETPAGNAAAAGTTTDSDAGADTTPTASFPAAVTAEAGTEPRRASEDSSGLRPVTVTAAAAQTHDPGSAGLPADDRPESARDDAHDRPAAADSKASSPDDLVVEPYGPDDPAYGPPSPRLDPGDGKPADARPAVGHGGDGEAAPAPRGPFEPLRPADRRVTAGVDPVNLDPVDLDPVDLDPADLDPGQARPDLAVPGHLDQDQDQDHPSMDGPQRDPADSGRAGHVRDDQDQAAGPPGPAAPAEPERLDFGPPSDPAAGTIGRLRDLYLTAEALSRDRLDRHFDELLDRQRKLISDYLAESPSLSPDAATESANPFGFDSAGSLAGLRGDLRGAP